MHFWNRKQSRYQRISVKAAEGEKKHTIRPLGFRAVRQPVQLVYEKGSWCRLKIRFIQIHRDFTRDVQRPDLHEQPSSRLCLFRQLNLSRGTVVHASRQPYHKQKQPKKKADAKIRREKTVVVKEGDGLHHPMGALPLNQGEVQYLTLRDLSSHDQDREEGKVGREEAAVPKGPLPI